ncbi:MAG: glycosyltransferase family 39 protein, partial [Myxococcota bacterium]
LCGGPSGEHGVSRYPLDAVSGAVGLTPEFKFNGFLLDLGSTALPTPIHAYFLLFWTVLGLLAVFCGAVGLAHLVSSTETDTLVDQWRDLPDTPWMVGIALLALVIPTLVRTMVLEGAPIADDESCYLFMGQLLAKGQLYAESPPMKLFFDRSFMINDGRLYPMYFIGWPAVMVPGLWLGVPGLVNPCCSALTSIALFLIARRLVGSSWARVCSVLYITSPLACLGAATLLSHTSCTMALSWAFWFGLRLLDEDASWTHHLGLALCFCLAFFIRPSSALGLGIPLLMVWGWTVWRGSGRARWAAVAAFVLPSLVSAGLFLGVNTAQNGDPFKPGYMRKAEYERENGYRFANWRQDRIHEALNTRQGLRAPGFVFDKPLLGVANTGLAVLRLNFALFGWPISLMLVLVAGWRGRRAWLFWGSLGSFSVTHLFGHDTGIDAFGPTHYFECLLPLVVLSTLGLRNAVVVAHKTREVEPHLGFRPELLPVTVVVALIGLNIFSYTPLRVEALGRIATDTHMPFKSAQTAGLRRAVVFAYRPFTTFCNSTPAEHFVFW